MSKFVTQYSILCYLTIYIRLSNIQHGKIDLQYKISENFPLHFIVSYPTLVIQVRTKTFVNLVSIIINIMLQVIQI